MTDLQIRILQYLNQSRDWTSGVKTAEHCGVSLNTVRKVIRQLKEEIGAYGLGIEAKPSSGYMLVYTDREAAESFFSSLISQINSPLFGRHTSQDYKVNYIIRRLLVSPREVPLQIISDELFYSVSSVRRDLEIVKKNLADFGLELGISKGTGYKIIGSEWSKRLCLMAQHKLYVNLSPELKQLETAFRRTFLIDDPDMRKCRYIVEDMIRDNQELSFKLIDFSLVIYYLPLIRTRKKYASEVAVDEYQMQLLNSSGILKESEKLLDKVKNYLPVDKTEIRLYAILLQIFRSVNDLSSLRREEIPLLRTEACELVKQLDHRIHISSHTKGELMDSFMCGWYEIRNKLVFHIIPDEEDFRKMEYIDPFAEDLCVEMAKVMEKNFGYHISVRQTLPMYYVFIAILERAEEHAWRRRAAVISTYGCRYAKYCAAVIERQYGWFFGKCDTMEFSELTLMSAARYDFVITDIRPAIIEDAVSAPEEIPTVFLHMDESDILNGGLRQLDKWFAEDMVKQRGLLITRKVMETDSIGTPEDFLEAIVSDIDPVDREGLKRGLSRRMYYRAFRRNSSTLFLTTYANTEYMGIIEYRFTRPLKIEGHRYLRAVCCQYDRDNLECCRYLRHFLREIFEEY